MTIQQYLIQASGNMYLFCNLKIYKSTRGVDLQVFLIVQFVCPRTCTLVGTEPDERSSYLMVVEIFLTDRPPYLTDVIWLFIKLNSSKLRLELEWKDTMSPRFKVPLILLSSRYLQKCSHTKYMSCLTSYMNVSNSCTTNFSASITSVRGSIMWILHTTTARFDMCISRKRGKKEPHLFSHCGSLSTLICNH